MKTVRFSQVVDAAGKPESHLVLTEPKKDRELQRAIKANRIVTLFQEVVGQTADHGEVGFSPGPTRQFLIFPRSVRKFEGRKIVGIKYDLYEPPRPSRKVGGRPKKLSGTKLPVKETPAKKSPQAKIIEFPQPSSSDDDDEEQTVKEMKKGIRRALAALEKGRQVAAFKILEQLAGD